MSLINEDEFTVQGADPSVPVGVAGERAGPAQPLTSDCSVPPVGNQAWGDYMATGSGRGRKEEVSNLFAKTAKIMRTPPLVRKRVSSLPDCVQKMDTPSREMEVFVKEKRKRESPSVGQETKMADITNTGETSPEKERPIKKSREKGNTGRSVGERTVELIKKIDMELASLRQVIRNNRNTKCEIKSIVDRLSRTVAKLSSSETLELLEESLVSGAAGIGQDELQVSTRVSPAIRDVGTQTDKSPWQARNEVTAKAIKEKIGKQRGFDGFETLSKQIWPAEVFVTVREVIGNPIWESKENDMAFCRNISQDIASTRTKFVHNIKDEG